VCCTDDVAGFVTFGPDRDTPPPAAGDPVALGELYAVNLAPRAWGRGVGRALVRAAADGLRALGHDEAVLWVVPANGRARRLYESERWHADGAERAFELYGVSVPEVRYRRTLSSA
jgi:GNAT superfamily N-acetyltransferase